MKGKRIWVLSDIKIFLGFCLGIFSEDDDQVVKMKLMCLFLKMLCWQLSLERMINSGRDNIKEKLVLLTVQMVFEGWPP